MAIATIHKLDKIIFPTAEEILALSNARWDAGIETMLERASGEADPMFLATRKQVPVMSFSTPQIDVIGGLIPINGLAITTAVNSYFKLATQVGNVARATASHKRLAISDCLAHWSSIKLPHNGRADIDVLLTTVFDGTNAPFAYTGSLALSGAIAATSLNYFGLGPISINGTALDGIQDVTIDSGISLIQEGDASEVYNTFTGLKETAPVITIKTLHMVNWDTLGLAGLALNGSTGLVIYARKYAADGTRVANATAGHVKYTALYGRAIPVDSNGEFTSPISDTLKVELRSPNDSTRPLTVAAAQAIT